MKTITFKAPESSARKLDAAARERGRSKSAILREMLEGRNREGRNKKKVTCFDLIGHLSGHLSGPTDLSDKKKHLKGYGR